MNTGTLSKLNETARREIRAEMARQSRTQRDLAVRLGWSRMYLSHRLNGSVILSLDDLDAIAAELSVPIDQLITPARAGG